LFNGCFGLLFPATELRHRIYDFAIEDMAFKLNLDPVVLIHREVLHEQYGILPAAELSNWSDEHREFYGLTQTCRQMRLEFGRSIKLALKSSSKQPNLSITSALSFLRYTTSL
jgi:hypothetical protein